MTRNEMMEMIEAEINLANKNGWKYAIRSNNTYDAYMYDSTVYLSMLPIGDKTIYADSLIWQDNEPLECLPDTMIKFLFDMLIPVTFDFGDETGEAWEEM